MKVVILAGGLGTRLKEETASRPKPMVEIGGRPILWHIMKIYAHHGFREFIVCLGYRGEVIKDYFLKYEFRHSDLTVRLGRPSSVEVHGSCDEAGWTVTLVDTGEKALKGARIKKVERFVDGETFLLTYGDGLANLDIKASVEFHRSHGRVATLTGVRPPSRFGEILVENLEVRRFTEKAQVSSGWINGGYFVLQRSLFDELSAGDDCDFEHGVLESLAGRGQLMAYPHEREWVCMDTLRDVEHLNTLWREGRAFWKVW